jgi:DNA invertase Pin-like site-specific DNA recombinase
MNQTLGYARVSTADQNPDLQVDELTAAGCHRIFVEYATGARAERRSLRRPSTTSGQATPSSFWRLDRLARSLRDLIDLVTTLEERGSASAASTSGDRSSCRCGPDAGRLAEK